MQQDSGEPAIDLSLSTDPEIGFATKILDEVTRLVSPLKVRYLVVGATARNIQSVGLMNEVPDRATKDVDIAIAIDNWKDYDRISRVLPRKGIHQHKFEVLGAEVDVVPFGEIEDENREICWPGGATRMNVVGYREARESAMAVTMPSGSRISVPSIAAQAVLKLMAWNDRRMYTSKDAVDLRSIITWYSEGPFETELFDRHRSILDIYEWETVSAGAHRLGEDMANLLSHRHAYQMVLDVLENQATMDTLAGSMGFDPRTNLQRIRAMRSGFVSAGAAVSPHTPAA
ncbi:MAG: hypothetical protein WBD41_16120 [Rhodococcus sp. (in: high G+C Gram-positive bacteria)]|jgi:predicted nucleotidyltransferase|uniref:hypothetical protein n=1 Tax=Rhodococcus sp. EPR-157 TaxID=1813677 RepID=UPI0012E798E5|nr:hypothetical protein [Rhodococcus sp. EPR-157]